MLKKVAVVAGALAVAGGIAYAYNNILAEEEKRPALLVNTAQAAGSESAATSSSTTSIPAVDAPKFNKTMSEEVKQPAAEDTKEQFWVLPLPKWDKSDKALSIDSLSNKQSLEHADFAGKRVLMRVDYNVPIKNGVIKDTARIDATLDTLKALLQVPAQKKPKCIVLICHFGRPGGKFKREDFSLAPVAKVLEGYLKDIAPVRFLPECVGPEVEREVNAATGGVVFLLENLRFHIEETGTGITAQGVKVKAKKLDVLRFRKALSNLGDIFVFEAFGAAHRPHSSVSGITIPQRVGGLLMARELNYFAKVLGNPKRPFLAIVGGAKVSDKIQVLENMLDLVDSMIIGGGMTYTFKKVLQNMEIGKSIYDAAGVDAVHRVVAKAKARNVQLHFAIDHIVADKFAADAKVSYVEDKDGIPEGYMALDIGPKSRELVARVMGEAQTILWNGPLGVFEFPAFAKGTEEAMYEMVKATQRGAITIIGGGDTGSASNKFSINGKPVSAQVSHVSTGGGSSLVLMEGNMLPGADWISDVRELPPNNIDLKQLYMQVQQLKAENYALKEEVEILRAHVFPDQALAEDDE